MSLSETQKTRVRMYLGYERGADLHPRLESKLVALSEHEETEVGAVLTKLVAVDDKLQTAALNNLDLERAEDVTFLGPDQLLALQDYGRTLVQRLVSLLGVPALHDYYAAGVAMGGVIPLG